MLRNAAGLVTYFGFHVAHVEASTEASTQAESFAKRLVWDRPSVAVDQLMPL